MRPDYGGTDRQQGAGEISGQRGVTDAKAEALAKQVPQVDVCRIRRGRRAKLITTSGPMSTKPGRGRAREMERASERASEQESESQEACR